MYQHRLAFDSNLRLPESEVARLVGIAVSLGIQPYRLSFVRNGTEIRFAISLLEGSESSAESGSYAISARGSATFHVERRPTPIGGPRYARQILSSPDDVLEDFVLWIRAVGSEATVAPESLLERTDDDDDRLDLLADERQRLLAAVDRIRNCILAEADCDAKALQVIDAKLDALRASCTLDSRRGFRYMLYGALASLFMTLALPHNAAKRINEFVMRVVNEALRSTEQRQGTSPPLKRLPGAEG